MPAEVTFESIVAEYDRTIGALTGENIRLRAALAAYEAAETKAEATPDVGVPDKPSKTK